MLEDIGNLGDFVGGIAVIITLIYLATQIPQLGFLRLDEMDPGQA